MSPTYLCAVSRSAEGLGSIRGSYDAPSDSPNSRKFLAPSGTAPSYQHNAVSSCIGGGSYLQQHLQNQNIISAPQVCATSDRGTVCLGARINTQQGSTRCSCKPPSVSSPKLVYDRSLCKMLHLLFAFSRAQIRVRPPNPPKLHLGFSGLPGRLLFDWEEIWRQCVAALGAVSI